MNRKISLLLVVILALTVSACGKKKEQVVNPGSTGGEGAVTGTPIDDANAFGTGYSRSALEALGIVGDPLNYRTLYFAYNSSSIDERSNIIAAAHARNLVSTAVSAATLEGHADERGTRDYNLALGERRARSVSDLMRTVGVGSTNINTISYGEERPADTAHTEAAWQQNRRVQIVY